MHRLRRFCHILICEISYKSDFSFQIFVFMNNIYSFFSQKILLFHVIAYKDLLFMLILMQSSTSLKSYCCFNKVNCLIGIRSDFSNPKWFNTRLSGPYLANQNSISIWHLTQIYIFQVACFYNIASILV